jgi:hypothetical protein
MKWYDVIGIVGVLCWLAVVVYYCNKLRRLK